MTTKKENFINKIEEYNDFWNIVDKLGWQKNNYDYNKIKNLIFLNFSNEEIIQLDKNLEEVYSIVYNYIQSNYNIELGDDSFSDLNYHLIGSGKEFLLSVIFDENKLKTVNYRESFAYAIPYGSEKNLKSYNPEEQKIKSDNIINKSIELYNENLSILKSSIIVNKDYIKDIESKSKPYLEELNKFKNNTFDYSKFSYKEMLDKIEEINKMVYPVRGLIEIERIKMSKSVGSTYETELFSYAPAGAISEYVKIKNVFENKENFDLKLNEKDKKFLRNKI